MIFRVVAIIYTELHAILKVIKRQLRPLLCGYSLFISTFSIRETTRNVKEGDIKENRERNIRK